MTKTLLLLDDDDDEQYILRDAFRGINIDVNIQQFLDFPSLLAHLETLVIMPHLLLFDVNLPGETGVEAIRFIKSQDRYQHLPVVMYSNSADDKTVDESFQYGASAYLKKTNTREALQKNLRILMAWNIQTVFNLPLTERTFLN
jgi:CheY-like chemotaxis protein